MKYKLILGVFITAIIIVGTIPVHSQTGKVTISFWYTENSSEAPGVLALVKEFEAKNPNIIVNEEAKGFFSAKETYLTQFSAQLEPTVFRAARDWVVEFAQQGLIQPVTPYMNATDKTDFLPDALRLVTYPDPNTNQSEIWGFPHLVDSPALFYNVQLVQEAGIDTSNWNVSTSLTWEQFTNYTQKVWDHQYAGEDADNPVYGFTFQGMSYGAQPAYYGHGAKLFSNGTVDYDHIAIDSNASRAALTFIKQVADADYTPPWAEQGWETINPLFMNGKVAFVQEGPWEIANYLQNAAEFNPKLDNAKSYASASNLGIMKLPHDDAGHTGAPLGGHAYVVTKRATGDVRDAAMKFAKFMSDTHALSAGAIDYYHVPVRQSVFDNPAVQSSAAWKFISAFQTIVNSSYEVPVDHRWAQLDTIFGNELDNYLSGDSTLDEFIAYVTSFWAEILVEGGAAATGTGAAGQDTSTAPFNMVPFVIALVAIPVIYRRKIVKIKT